MRSKIFFLLIIMPFFCFAQKIKENHSTQILKCSTCHSCDVPTKENPCIKPCPREKIISIDQLPEEGPNVLTIDKFKKQTDVYEPVIFSHRLHAEMSGMGGGCKMCHHYNPPGRVIGCSDCHELTRKREDVSKPDLKGAYHRQCIDCHRLWSGKVECLNCHQLKNSKTKTDISTIVKKNGKRIHPQIITPAIVKFDTPKAAGKLVTFYHLEHTDLFSIDCSKCHKNESCSKCHAKDLVTLKAGKTLEQKHLICSNCHNTKQACSYCHLNTVKPGFNHKERTGFDIDKYHGKLKCVRCHTTKEKFTGLRGDCSSCHGIWTHENFRHKITGIALDENHSSLECTDCHQEKNYANPTCSNCHEDKSFPKFFPGNFIKKR